VYLYVGSRQNEENLIKYKYIRAKATKFGRQASMNPKQHLLLHNFWQELQAVLFDFIPDTAYVHTHVL